MVWWRYDRFSNNLNFKGVSKPLRLVVIISCSRRHGRPHTVSASYVITTGPTAAHMYYVCIIIYTYYDIIIKSIRILCGSATRGVYG